MNWYYSSNEQQLGPVSDTEFNALVGAGTVTPQTLVWREGLPNWMPYTETRFQTSLSPAPPALTSDAAPCAECGQDFSKTEMVRFENSYICSGCKPVFFQKLREGVPTSPSGKFWRSGRTLVSSTNTTLPKRCVKCNTPTEMKQIKRNLYWHHPLISLLFLINILVYAVVAMIVRKRAVAFISICPQHRKARRNVILASWAMAIGGLVMLIGGAANKSGLIGLAGVVLFLAGLIYGIWRGRLVAAKKIDKEFLFLSGCGPEFLASFPEWSKAR